MSTTLRRIGIALGVVLVMLTVFLFGPPLRVTLPAGELEIYRGGYGGSCMLVLPNGDGLRYGPRVSQWDWVPQHRQKMALIT